MIARCRRFAGIIAIPDGDEPCVQAGIDKVADQLK